MLGVGYKIPTAGTHGGTAISKCSSARTPTGARLRRRPQRSSVRTPTGAGLRRQHQNSSARTPTGAGLRSQYQLLVSSILMQIRIPSILLPGCELLDLGVRTKIS